MDFRYQWSWDLKASPERLWRFVADTDRFNQDAGLPSVEKSAGAGSGTRLYESRAGGLVMQWEEHPFEWIYPRHFSVERYFLKGPIKRMRARCVLEPRGNGTRLKYEIEMQAGRFPGMFLMPLQVRLLSARFEKVFLKYDLMACGNLSEQTAAAKRKAQYPDTFKKASQRLSRYDALAERFIAWLQEADERSLVRIRPYVLAREWNVPKNTMTSFMMEAANEGLIDFQWEILCPHCRSAEKRAASLQELSETGYCESCGLDYAVNFDQLVELTFRPNALIRNVKPLLFCVGSPQRTPHILAQGFISQEETRNLQLPLEPARYRLRFKGIAREQYLNISESGVDQASGVLNPDGLNSRGELAVKPGALFLLENKSDERRQFFLERVSWMEDAFTASEAIRAPRFRELFEAQVLQPGVRILAGNQAVVFTDIKGSTQFYEQEGDGRAFSEVAKHFECIREIFESREGAIVKTMGDAVMAVFASSESALEALMEAQLKLSRPEAGRQVFELKGGIHYGPCMAVNLNGRLDYFGSTVNLASRLAHLSDGRNVVLQAEAFDAFENQAKEKWAASSFETAVKGFDGRTLRLCRITRPV